MARELDLLILTMETDPSGPRFAQEAKRMGLAYHFGFYRDIPLGQHGRPQLPKARRLLARRPHATNDINNNHFGLFWRILAEGDYAAVFDGAFYAKDLMAYEDKLGKQGVVANAGVNIPELVEPERHDWSFPLIAKKRFAGRSFANYLLTNAKEYSRFESKFDLDEFVYQHYLAVDHDYRVLLLRGDVLGVMERKVRIKADRRVTVKGIGKAQLPEPVLADCKRIVTAVGADLLGVDVAEKEEGGYFFIEYNFSPQFLGFERETGVNVARQAIEVLLKQ